MIPFGRDDFEVVLVPYLSRAPLEKLLDHLPESMRVVVVDNSADQEDLSELIAQHPNVRHLDSGGNLGFAAAANLGAEAASAPVVIFLNIDAQPSLETLQALTVQLAADPEVACCAPALLDESGAMRIDAGGWLPGVGNALIHALGLHRVLRGRGISVVPHRGEVLNVDWLAGPCLAVRRDLFLEVGGFDTAYFLYNCDMDLGRKLKERGYRQLIRADLEVPHIGGAASDVRREALWSWRGSGMGIYLQRNNGPLEALAIRALLTAGFLGRAAVYALTRRTNRSAEMLSYVRSLARPRQSPG